jgi:flagellar hook protein FlgE
LGETGVLSVIAQDQIDMNNPGGLISTDSPLDMAISGNGFFNVSINPNDPNQTNYLLTRAGSFLPDSDGNLVNAAGYFLAGYRFNPDGTLPAVDRSTVSQMETVNVGNVSLSATATSEMSVFGNLPAQETGTTTPGAPFISSTEFFTPLGDSQRVQFSWQPTSTTNTWDLTIRDNSGSDLGTITVAFTDSGASAGSPLGYSNVTSLATTPASFAFDTTTGTATLGLVTNGSLQEVNVSLGAPGSFEGISQFVGDYSQQFDRDGSGTGSLARTEIEDGILYGVFTNGSRRALYEIPLSIVENPFGLVENRGNAYTRSGETGEFQAMQPGTSSAGSIIARALEGANVDVAQELTDLIKIQRAYSTNAKVVTTVDEMMEETTRLKR